MMYSRLGHLLQIECNKLKTILYQVNDFKKRNKLKTILHQVNGYISRRESLADGASRGWNAAQVNSDDCWFQGPSVLWQNIKFLPSRDVNAELSNDDPEVNKDITFCSTLLSEVFIASTKNRISSWLKLKKVIALVLLYNRKFFESVKKNEKLRREID